MDELMDTLRVVNATAYESVMRKLRRLWRMPEALLLPAFSILLLSVPMGKPMSARPDTGRLDLHQRQSVAVGIEGYSSYKIVLQSQQSAGNNTRDTTRDVVEIGSGQMGIRCTLQTKKITDFFLACLQKLVLDHVLLDFLHSPFLFKSSLFFLPYSVIMEAAGVRLPARLVRWVAVLLVGAPLPFLLVDRHRFELSDQLIQVFAVPGQFEQLEPFGFPCQLFNDLGGVCHFVHILTSFCKGLAAPALHSYITLFCVVCQYLFYIFSWNLKKTFDK